MNPIDIDLAGIPDGPMCWGCRYHEEDADKKGRIVQTSCQALPASQAPARAGADAQAKLDNCPKPQGEWP